MAGPLFAMMSPSFDALQRVVVAAAVLLTALLARRHWRTSGPLALAALLCGPLIGASVAGLFFSLEDVSPLDVGYYLSAFIGIGALAGIIVGATLLLAPLWSQRRKALPKSPVKAWDGES